MRDGLANRLDPVLACPFCLVHGRIGRRKELGGRLRGGDRGDPEQRETQFAAFVDDLRFVASLL